MKNEPIDSYEQNYIDARALKIPRWFKYFAIFLAGLIAGHFLGGNN